MPYERRLEEFDLMPITFLAERTAFKEALGFCVTIWMPAGVSWTPIVYVSLVQHTPDSHLSTTYLGVGYTGVFERMEIA
jgi:hypothetical protein